jgi:DNA polymerase (family 10)
LRGVARKKGYKLSEYGIFKKSRGDEWKYTAGVTEEDIYSSLGMQWIPPEMREGRGEIKSAIAGTIPHDLITGEDIKGDLHIHTDRTDGKASAEDIIQKCTEKGYKYFAVTDHSQHIRIANGMDGKSLLEHCGKLKRLASSCGRISLLTGVEVDILADGELDIEDDVLRELDLVVAAVHSRFSLNRARQTDRLLRAIDNKNVNILAHPSGRLITSRRGLDFDRERVFKAASEAGVALEINTHGQRIDLNDSDCIVARELGAKFAINTDAHSLDQLDMIKYGVITGRKAVLRKADVINTYELDRLLKFLIRS